MSRNNGNGFVPTDLSKEWSHYPRWTGLVRPYSADDVERLRGSVLVEHTLAKLGAQRGTFCTPNATCRRWAR